MQLLQKIRSKKSNLLFYLALLTCLFIFIEIAVFIYGNEIYLGDYHYVADHLHVPWSVLPGVLYFFCIQCMIHVSYLVMVFITTRLIAIALRPSLRKEESIGIGLWTLGIIVILLANHYFFPNTKFACLTYFMGRLGLLKMGLMLSTSVLAVALLIAFYGAWKWMRRHPAPTFLWALLIVLGGSGFKFFYRTPVISDAATAERPNIILVGVDALRPDFLSFFGSNLNTVHIDRFLNHAAVFAESMTPDARTYPAWTSILTGEYPKENGVRFDLSATMGFDPRQTLPSILREHGYKTVFAMDEVRFSNIDQTMGFDELITPPIGFNDFLIGSLNDFPMSNLLVNTFVGRYLFPYSYANRAIYITYEPNTFIHLLDRRLERSRNKPLFLAVHFCLPHYPYSWRNQSNNHHFLYNYRAAILRADLQVYDFLKMLKAHQLLNHAIVVFLSDHGEALELAGDRVTENDLFIRGPTHRDQPVPRFYPPSIKNEGTNQSTGHGTDVLSFTQYHNVLAFRFFGLPGQAPRVISGLVSLLDIKPTILDFLQVHGAVASGRSLTNYILGKQTRVKTRPFFIESDFSPAAVRSVHPETRKLLFQGIDYFEINPITTRLTIKPSMGDLIISSKQYADIDGEWVLALYPEEGNTMATILVNLQTGEWTDDLRTTFAKASPALRMLKALKLFYGHDISLHPQFSS